MSQSYETLFAHFDTPLARRIRRESYGRDTGQHSWVAADELEEDIPQLGISSSSHLLDLGCGPCGPLSFILDAVRCRGTGVDVSTNGLAAGRAQAASRNLADRLSVVQASLDAPLPFASASVDAATALDVVVHIRDRVSLFREVARVLKPRGRFLFTDAGVITGAISSDEMSRRAVHGNILFAPPGFNERALETAGFQLISRQDRTASLVKYATGRLEARKTYRADLEPLEGTAHFEREQAFLETVAGLSRRGALARILYAAESRVA